MTTGTSMDPSVLKTYEASLTRCDQNPVFLDRLYKVFLASFSACCGEVCAYRFHGPETRAAGVDLNSMLMAAARPGPSQQYLRDIAERHSSRQLAVGTKFYDYWLDSLLACNSE